MFDTTHVNFADPWVAYMALPLFAAWLFALVKRSGWFAQPQRDGATTAAVRYSSTAKLQRLRPSKSLRLRRFVQRLRIPAVLLLLLALARPQSGRSQTEVITEGVDIMLILDTSGSMQALDLDAEKPVRERRHRLDVVKDVVAKFVKKRPNDQMGMVVFGSEAFTQCPLTLDHGILASFLDQIEIGIAGQETALGEALATAVKRLKDSRAKSKVAILLTDGRQTAGFISPTKAAELAKTFGIKVYTIGAGTRGRAPFPVPSLFGTDYQLQEVSIDEASLRTIASATGGEYFRAEDATALAEIYDRIDSLERTEISSKSYMQYDERFALFALPALLLLLTEITLLGTRLRKIP